MKILSLNLALRPVSIGDEESKKKTGGNNNAKSDDALKTSATTSATQLPHPCACEEDYHLYNAHEARVRGFLKWLSLQTPMPDVLCFQELMWYPLVEVLCGVLEKFGYIIHENVDPRNPLNQSVVDPKTKLTIAPSGLAIFVYTPSSFSNLEIVSAQSETFETRIGLDMLARKGFQWCVLRNTFLGREFVVMNLHPQAYCKIDPKSPACEDAKLQSLRNMATQQVAALGTAKTIEMVHKKQFGQIRKSIIEKKLNVNRPIVLIGDFNVNSYGPEPWSKEETNVTTAQKGVGREWKDLLKTSLSGFEVVKPSNLSEYPYSWDGKRNSFAGSLGCAFQLIDHALILPSNRLVGQQQVVKPNVIKPNNAIKKTKLGGSEAKMNPTPPMVNVCGRTKPQTIYVKPVTMASKTNTLTKASNTSIPNKPKGAIPNLFSIIENLFESHTQSSRILPIQMAPTPELTPFWSAHCFLDRTFKVINQKQSQYAQLLNIHKNLVLTSQRQVAAALVSFTKRYVIGFDMDLTKIASLETKDFILRMWVDKLLGSSFALAWQTFIQNLDFIHSSQIWLGAVHYGIDPKDLGYVLTSSYKIGYPHAFRMLSDVSDHFALVLDLHLI